MQILRLYFCLLLTCIIFSNCNSNDKSSAAKESDDMKQSDRAINTEQKDSTATGKEKAMANQEAVQQALWMQYDSIKEIRKSIPDSIANSKNKQERYFYNLSDGNLDHIQSDIRNLSDSILLKQLKLHVADLADVINANEANLKRIENFSTVLKKVTFGISKTLNLATALVTNGIVKPRMADGVRP